MRTTNVALRLLVAALPGLHMTSLHLTAADFHTGNVATSIATRERISLELYDFTNIDSKTMVQAERVVSDIFALAALDTDWHQGELSEARRIGTDFSIGRHPCLAPLHSSTVKIQLLPRATEGFSPTALGYALPCAQFGVQVTVYMDRIENVERLTSTECYRVLGHALAHEVGHILLRSPDHTPEGLLKSLWSPLDWQRAAIALVPFSRDQAEQMKAELHRLSADGRRNY